MRNNKKQYLYESIMKNIAKTIKQQLNENTDNLISNDEYLEYDLDGFKYIYNNDSMYAYYTKSHITSLVPSRKIALCVTDGNKIYYNPNWMNKLNAKEQAFAILHCCAHINMNHHAANNLEENIALNRKVNRFLEDKFPEFKGVTSKLNGFI